MFPQAAASTLYIVKDGWVNLGCVVANAVSGGLCVLCFLCKQINVRIHMYISIYLSIYIYIEGESEWGGVWWGGKAITFLRPRP